MRGKSLFCRIAISISLLVATSSLAMGAPEPTRVVISSNPSITFSTGSALQVIKAKRYPSVPFASHSRAPFPGGGVLQISCAGQKLVVAYVSYDPKFAAAQASEYGEMLRIQHRHNRPRPSNTMLDYSTYQFRSMKGLQISEGTRVGKSSDGAYRGIIEIVASNHDAECDITSSITGKSKAEVAEDLKKLRPVFDRISATITIH